MKYAQTNTNGLPTAFYDKAVHGDKIPADAIEIDDTNWQAHISGDLRQWDGSAWVSYTPPPQPLDEVKARAKQDVIRFADEIGDGLTADYPKSERDMWPFKVPAAKAYLAGTADADDKATIEDEATEAGKDPVVLANTILTKYRWFNKVGTTMSGMRQKAFEAIDAAADHAAVDAVLTQMKADAEKALADLLAVKP